MKSSLLLFSLKQFVNFYIVNPSNLDYTDIQVLQAECNPHYISENKYQSQMKVEQRQKKGRQLIKIKFKGQGKSKNKVSNYKDLNYQQFAQKLCTIFEIEKERHYKLFYKDREEDEILLNTEEDYQILLDLADPMILYLEETEDSDVDFRKYLQQTQQILILKAQIKQLNQIIDSLKSKGSQSTVEIMVREQKKQNKLDFNKLVQDERKRMQGQIQAFRKYLKQRSDNTITQKLKQIKQELKKEYKTRAGNFQHRFGCQNTNNCKFGKKIVGLRYKCLVCSIDLCQYCADQQLECQNYNHNPTHPMVKFRNSQYDSKVVEMKDSSMKMNEPKKGSKISPQLPESQEMYQNKIHIAQLLEISPQKASVIVRKYPKLSREQLVVKALEEMK